jgi:ATP adenylyltransferase
MEFSKPRNAFGAAITDLKMTHFRTGDLGRPLSRFNWVTSGKARGPLPVFDEPVAANLDAVVVPSLGSIVPGWTLLVPRQQSTNFAALDETAREALSGLRRYVEGRLRAAFPGTVYEFEHGPARAGGTLGCGVDQAHLHIVPLSVNLVEKVRSIPGTLINIPPDVSDAWSLVPNGVDYLFVRNTETKLGAIVLPSTLRSQTIRQIIADGVGSSDAWDYREATGLKHAMRTKGVFTTPPAA